MGGMILGGVDVFVFAWIVAWYFLWMHNTSLVKKEE
jgi:hypothetical protein